MDEKRAKTVEALSTFVESQKALLERTRVDIARLKQLRNNIASQPTESCDFESFKSELASHRLSERADLLLALPDDLDWSLFDSCDPTPFKTLEANTRLEHKQRNEQPLKQIAPVTPLQQLVKDARASILDPVLKAYPPPSSDEEDDPPDPEELRRIRERAKIRELKRRKIHGSSRFYGVSGLGLRQADADAVFVREDQEDESAEVDIGLDEVAMRTNTATPSTTREIKMEVDTPPTSISSPPPAVAKEELPSGTSANRSNRIKRTTRKVEPPSQSLHVPPNTQPMDQPSKEEEAQLDRKGKPRPETYKQAWSVEEQHLLERLLDEIPEGAKNRWAQISKAMNGKRTPRQVASRVQKYFEKLKRYGLDVGGSSNRNDG